MMKQNKRAVLIYMLAFLGAVAGILLDQYTKFLAVRHLKDQPAIPIIRGVFSLHYLENKGAAFGLLQNQRVLFMISTAIVFILVILLMYRTPKIKRFVPLLVLGPCIIAGATGNLIDRIRLGYVVDFFYFEWIDFPIFNVADVFVTTSFIILLFLILFHYKENDMETLSQAWFRKSKEKEKQ